MRIRALTLYAEWLPAFTHMGKDIENRRWLPPKDMLRRCHTMGAQMALHCSASWPTGRSERWGWFADACSDAGWNVFHFPHGKMEIQRHETDESYLIKIPLGHIWGTTQLMDVIRPEQASDDPWAFGPYCWRLANLQPLPKPVPARGRQRLWWTDLGPDWVDELELSVRAANVLQNRGIESVAEMLEHDAAWYLRPHDGQPGMKRRTLAELRDVLAEYGLKIPGIDLIGPLTSTIGLETS